MKFRRHISQEKGYLQSLDIAPLIDIIFLLLIFFMLTSSFIVQPGIKVNIPKAITGESLYKKGIEIIISEKNEIFLNERRVSQEELKSIIKIASKDEKSVMIKADRKSELGKIVQIWDMCRNAGVSEVHIATTQ